MVMMEILPFLYLIFDLYIILLAKKLKKGMLCVMKKKKVSRYNFGNVRAEVNKFDKQFGIELGKMNPLGEPEMVFA